MKRFRCMLRGFAVFALLAVLAGCGEAPPSVAEQKEVARLVGSIPDVPDVPEVPVEAQQKGVDDILNDFKGLCDWEKTACETAARDCFGCLGDKGLSSACKAPCGKALGACEAAAICIESLKQAGELIR
jgi:hypothetical protein